MPPQEYPGDEHHPVGDRSGRPHGSTDPVAADAVRFGRSDLDDAPPPLKKRWIVVAAGLAVAATATAAVIAGTDVVSDEDLALPPDNPIPSQDDSGPDEDLDPDRAIERCRSSLRTNELEGSNGIPPPPGDADVLYLQTADDYVVVVVSNGSQQALCAFNAAGEQQSAYTEDGALRQQLVLLADGPGTNVNLILAGRVNPEVTHVEIQSDRRAATPAHVANGFFSVWVPVEKDNAARNGSTLGENLDYVFTLKDGSTETEAVDFGGPPEGFAAGLCFEQLGIELRPPEREETPGGSNDRGGYRFVAEHSLSSYTFGVATDGDDLSACAVAPGASQTTWEASASTDMPERSLIDPFEPRPEATETGPYPVIGRAASQVVSVEVVRADGRRREASLLRGFYSLMLPAAQTSDLIYVVTTEDGERTTFGSG